MSFVLPKKIIVSEIISSRYPNSGGIHNSSWDERITGIDVIKSSEGNPLKLYSDGMQSTPQKGWSIMLTSGNEETGYRWTLYGVV